MASAEHRVALARQRGVGRGSGLEVEALSGYVFELGEDDRCVFFALYNDPERARAAARSRESGASQ